MSMQILNDIPDIEKKLLGETNVKVLSFGCGVDSTAGYLILKDEGILEQYDEIIWADTGSEQPETYAYFDYLTKTLGWKIKIIKSKYGKIYDYYKAKRVYPTRFFRDCTGKFKIDPINRYLRTMYGKKAHFDMDIFINYDEAVLRMRTSKYKYSTLMYPLVERKITRDQCKKIIEEHGMPVPHKSGCFFCWAQPPKSWLKLKMTQPELFKKSRELEVESAKRHKNKQLLINLKGKDMPLGAMDEFLDDTGCGCFNYNTESEEEEEWVNKPF